MLGGDDVEQVEEVLQQHAVRPRQGGHEAETRKWRDLVSEKSLLGSHKSNLIIMAGCRGYDLSRMLDLN